MARASYTVVQLVNETNPETGTKYITTIPSRGNKSTNKLRLKKYDPVLRKHCWFVQRKMPNPKA